MLSLGRLPRWRRRASALEGGWGPQARAPWRSVGSARRGSVSLLAASAGAAAGVGCVPAHHFGRGKSLAGAGGDEYSGSLFLADTEFDSCELLGFVTGGSHGRRCWGGGSRPPIAVGEQPGVVAWE